ncbi:MAG: alpha-L-glutamate ligase-like protein [Candidatus Binatia bacterium]|nr:MAG: alpha-L-glutamate ligase-like protein [Candidatus Binatia bacterium]
MAVTFWDRLRTLRRDVLGLNRRNHELGIAFNPPHLVALVDNKVATKDALASARVPTPRTFATFRTQASLSALTEVLRESDNFVVKPARGAGGEGIVVIVSRRGDQFVKASGELLSWPELHNHACEILAGAYALSETYDEVLVEERLDMHPGLSRFAFKGIPDVRVLLAFGVPILAMMRLPTRQSDGRANLHLGGIGVGLDLLRGTATHAVWKERPARFHPDTDAPLAELAVPFWDRLLAVAAACFDCVPLGYLGVDLVVDPHRGPCVLELNARPGLGIQLANHVGLRPLLQEVLLRSGTRKLPADDRVALGLEIYRKHVRPEDSA